MKFVKRISLFFIYPMSMFAIGFVSNMAIMEFFYPGDDMTQQITEDMMLKAESGEESLEVSLNDEPIVTANTHYVVQRYHTDTGDIEEEEEAAPDKFIGLNREKLSGEIAEYNNNPSLTDLEQGFHYMELVSFSPVKVVVRKSYEPVNEEKGFFLLNENHYVVVYDNSLSQVYMNTDILVEELPENLQQEILNMKYVEDEGELYNFLESYSS